MVHNGLEKVCTYLVQVPGTASKFLVVWEHDMSFENKLRSLPELYFLGIFESLTVLEVQITFKIYVVL